MQAEIVHLRYIIGIPCPTFLFTGKPYLQNPRPLSSAHMLETIIRGRSITTIKPSSSSSSALIPFEPRSVTLAKHQQKMKNKKMSSETLEIDTQGKIVVEKSTQKSKKKKKRTNDSSSSLLHSIAIYLENKGFTKTLSAFKSESLIDDDELDGLKEHTLDLEEMYTKCLETSKCDAKTNSNGSEKLDSQKEEVAVEDKGTKSAAATESISKVKRKERNGDDADVVNEQHGVGNGFTKEKKKKSKLVPDSTGENTREVGSEAVQDPAVTMVFKAQSEELENKPKDKKKKKSKRTSETLTENVEQSVPEALPKVSIEKTSAEEKNVKSKDKKKKKSKPTSEDDAEEPAIEDLEKPDPSKEEKSSKKRKRPSSEENKSQPDEKVVTKESKQSNNEVSEEKGGDGDQVAKANILQESDGHAGKKRKTEHVQEEAGQHANGSLSNSGKQGSTRKQPNGSAEPKTVNAFKRVDVEKVEFINEKLQDNSYWAKDGADSGYGAKAQEVLGQVRGRDFRHEKTKKKRGSYRGGQIDLQSHSFKFNNSDDE